MPNEEQRLVSSLWDKNNWKLEELQFPISTQIAQIIQGILVAQLTRLFDSFIWPQNSGVCLVWPASKFIFQEANVPFAKTYWNWIWKLQCPKKIQSFIWKSMRIDCLLVIFSLGN